MDESERSDLDFGGLGLVDFSSENDALIDNQSLEDQYNNDNISSGLLDAVDAEKAVVTADVSGQMGQMSNSSEPLEPERAKTGKCNLRKSLAWDTSFFTSAGVLDPDELSSMIKGNDKVGKHFLPGIEEDISRSTDSLSTLESECLNLESFEAVLFEDIRASIQKSSKVCNTTCSSKVTSGDTESQVLSSSKKMDLVSKNMVKPKPASSKQTIAPKGPGKLEKQASGCSQGTQPVTKNGAQTSSLPKAPKVIGRPNPISSAPLRRAASLDAKHGKIESDKAKVPGKVAPVSKVPRSGGSSRTVPKPAPFSKPSSTSSLTGTKKERPRSSSSNDSSHSSSSVNVGISPVKSNRRRIDSRISNRTSSSSILKTPSKVALNKKGQCGPLAHSVLSKLSSNSSPASSISEWSSASSSSTLTVNQRSSTSRASIGTSSPHRSIDSDAAPALNHHNQSNEQMSDIRENKVSRLPSENPKTASTQLGAPSRPPNGKPSGLRLPSPKIGFFDGVKPAIRTPNGNRQSYSGIPAGPRVGAGISSPSGGSSKTKLVKVQPARSATASGNMKVDNQKPASPLPSQKLSNASTKVSSVSRGVKKYISKSPIVQNETDGENCFKVEKVEPDGSDRANDFPDTGLDAEKTGSLSVLKSEINLEKPGSTNLKDIKTAPIEGGTCALSSHYNAENAKLSEEPSEEFVGKETGHFEDLVDGLNMHAGDMDSKQELRREFVGNSITQIVCNHPDSSKEPFVPGQKKGSPINLSGPSPISPSPVTFEITVSTRTPLAVKNSLCNSEGDLSTRSSVGVVEKTASPLESAQTENA